MLGLCLRFKYFLLKFLLLRLQYTIAATATIDSTRRRTANGANNTGQRLAGLMAVRLVKGEGVTLEDEGTTLERRLVEAVEVISIKAIHNSD